MESALFWLALATLAVWSVGAVRLGLGNLSILYLRDLPPAGEDAPPVSVVIAARDEARHVEAALASVLGQRYPSLEVVVVDDRSSDGTTEILRRMERETARLRVIRVDELPPGWLGKNHALVRGAEAASGEWLLFSDADVVMDPRTVSRAVGFAEREGIDHLAVAPELAMPTPLLDLFAGSFVVFFSQYAEPWKARDPRSRRHVGVGAFNLVRASVYRAVGGHRPIAMRPDEDVKLGKLIKRAGFRQEVLFGRGQLSVEWYASLGEVVRGLEKNAFAGLEYSVPAVVASSLALLLLNVWPFLAVLLTDGATRLLNAATAAVMMALYLASTRASGADPRGAPFFPLATLLFVFIVVRSMVLALRRGGIRWRGTHYPLDELRANRV